MISRLLKSTYHLAVYTIGVSVLVVAVAATAVRILLPDIGTYRSEIESWVSNYTELPVAIRSIEADWQGWTPRLYLEDIDLLSSNSITPIINFEQAQISIDLLASLINRQIIPKHLIVSGFRLALIRDVDGSIDIEGINVDNYQYQDQNNSNNELANWLFGQSFIELQNVNIEWIDLKHGQNPVLLTSTSLSLQSDSSRMQINGSALLPASYGDSMNFAIDVTGNLLTSDWTAELFMHGMKINPDNWYRAYWPADINVNGGSATTSIWSTWENARLTGVEGFLEYNDFQVQLDNEKELDVSHLDYRFSGQETASGWLMNFHFQDVLTEHGNWPGSDITILIEQGPDAGNTSYSTSFSYLKLDDILPILSSLSFLPAKVKTAFTEYSIHGELYDGSLYVKPHNSAHDVVKFDVHVDNLTLQHGDDILPVSDISGRMSGSFSDGKILFENNSATLTLDKNGTKPNRLLEIDGELSWSVINDNYLFTSSSIEISDETFSSKISGALEISADTTHVDLVAHASEINYTELVKILPDTPRFRIKNWIQRAISGGSLESINVVFRGNTANFPFDNHDGQFKIFATVSDANLAYSANWPSIKSIDADLIFAGRGLTIDVHKGKVYDSLIENATATIPDLGTTQRTVHINGLISGNTGALKKYVAESPLSSHLLLNRTSNYFSEDGGIELALTLAVPINSPGRQTDVKGMLRLSDTTLTTDITDLSFKNVNGVIQFTRNSVNASDVSANYNGYDVVLAVTNDSKITNSPVTISISGNGDEKFIASQVDNFFPNLGTVSKTLNDKFSGSTDWHASLTYTPNQRDNKLERVLNINSDLYGMEIQLPYPLNKHKYISTDLVISRNLDNPAIPLQIKYGDLFTSSLGFTEGERQSLETINIKLGTGEDVAVGKGIFIYGELDSLPLNEWLQQVNTADNKSNSTLDLPITTAITIKNLRYYGQIFPDTNVIASNEEQQWQVVLSGPSISGEMTVPQSPSNTNPILANLEFIHLQKSSGGNDPSPVSPTDIPAITAKADLFSYNGIDFGALEFTAVSADNGLILNNLLFTKPSLTVRANGQWIVDDQSKSISDFAIQAHAVEFSKLLEPFGYSATGINKGETHLSIDANWLGTPTDFSLEKLNGAISMQIAQGQLLEFEPAAGRLFGLLSLQALPRRLLLDFSDLLGKGMAFDGIQGSFLIENGNAYTEDLTMKGPSVDILIFGRTGLSAQDYDQKAIVTPQISDSLAVATGFLGPVGIGLGTVLYLAGNMFEPLQDSINKILRYEYSISGSWDDPVIEKSSLVQDNNG